MIYQNDNELVRISKVNCLNDQNIEKLHFSK